MISKARKVRSLFEHSQQTTSHTRTTVTSKAQEGLRFSMTHLQYNNYRQQDMGLAPSLKNKQTNKQQQTKPHPQDTEIASYSVGSSPVL